MMTTTQQSSSMIDEAIEHARNDISRINVVKLIELDIDQQHFEDIYKEDRLDREMDINNIDVHRLMFLITQQEKHLQPITTATIRKLSTPFTNMRIQLDSGANRSITPHLELLHVARKIDGTPFEGVGGTIVVDTVGYMKLRCEDDSSLWVKTYFSADVDETIISPTDIALSTENKLTQWDQSANVMTGNGFIELSTETGLGRARIPLVMINGLWYTRQSTSVTTSNNINKSIICRLTKRAEYEHSHQRLGYAGDNVMRQLHKCADGVPNLGQQKHQFHKCETCMRAEVKAAPKQKSITTTTNMRGQQFHMDYGFVRGSDYKDANEKGGIVISRDGYNSYLIIVDAFTRYTWVYLTADKQPPLSIVSSFLDRYGLKEGTHRQVRCDQGGELARSSKFREIIQLAGYSVEPTGADNSSQDGVAERPNQTFSNMMRSLLMNANLSSKFWSYALIQSVFIKNRIPHSFHDFKKSPFEMLTGRKPDIKDLKIFGSRVVVKNPGKRAMKLDDHTSSGIFLHHTSTTAISKFIGDSTGREKTTSHIVYDEAHYTQENKPIGAQVLINNGCTSTMTDQT